MKRVLLSVVASFLCASVYAAPVPASLENWDVDPLALHFRNGEIQCAVSNRDILAQAKLPKSACVTIHAKFRADRVIMDGWSTAGLAVVDNGRDFWHVALVQAPAANGGGHFFELCEMRNGEWLSQDNLKIAFMENGAPWQTGRTYAFSLSLDSQGVTGEIKDESGKTVYRKRYLFTAPAVRCGIPALHANGGFQGAFKEIEVETSEPVVAEGKEPAYPPYRSDSFVSSVKGPAAGFFRVRQNPDGRWWVIDPLGRGVVLMGVDHVTFWGHYCQALNKHPHFEKNKLKYASKEQWETETLGRLKSWGFNFLGAGCDPALKHRGLIHTVFLSLGDTLAASPEEYYITPNIGTPCSGFPNVFHPDFAASCEYRARKECAPNKNDPWLFGYFIDNELAWWGRGALDTGLFDTVMKKAATHTSKTALRDFLSARVNNDLAAFNKIWGTSLKSFDDILALSSLPSGTQERVDAKKDFLRLAAERYFSISAAAIRKADPNHLVMGARFAGIGGAHQIVWEVSGKYCDVVTFNCYPWADIDENVVYMSQGAKADRAADCFTKYYGYVNRPMLITEWSFPALDAGLPSCHGAGQRFRTQAERTAATRLFAKTMLSLPFLVGYDYFMWVDEPALGITKVFPEDSNYGLINEDGVPYPAITQMFAELQKNAGDWRMKPLPAATAKATPKACLDAKTCVANLAGAGSADGKKVEFTRDGSAFRVTTPDQLVLSGAIGRGFFLPSVSWHGKAFGAYNAMLCLNGNRWIDIHQVDDVQFQQDGPRGVLELTGSYHGDEGSFAVTHRLTVFPDRPLILCELVRVANKGSLPLKMHSAYFRLYAPFYGTGKTAVPNLWKGCNQSCWMDEKDGRFIGFTAPQNSDATLYFWVGNSNDMHPDASFEFGDSLTLASGAVFTPASPMYLACLLGDTGPDGWNKQADALSALMK